MSHVYTVAAQKGGTAKTTTAAALGAGLALKGHSVLLIDLDPQCSLSYIVAANTDGVTSLDILTHKAEAQEAIQRTKAGDIIPASRSLAGADAFINETGKEYRLREALEDLQGAYDYIVIDTPPALGILTVNALVAADSVIVPAQADVLSLQGIGQLADTIAPVKKYCNPALSIDGILLTRYSARSVLSREVAELAGQLAEKLGTKVFNSTIRDAVAVREAQITQRTIFDYAPKAKATEDYAAFIKELTKKES